MEDRDADLPAVVHAKHAGHQVGQGVIAKVRGNVADAETLPRLQADTGSGSETAKTQFQAGTRCTKGAVDSTRQCRRWTGGRMRTLQTCAPPRHIKQVVFSAG